MELFLDLKKNHVFEIIYCLFSIHNMCNFISRKMFKDKVEMINTMGMIQAKQVLLYFLLMSETQTLVIKKKKSKRLPEVHLIIIIQVVITNDLTLNQTESFSTFGYHMSYVARCHKPVG